MPAVSVNQLPRLSSDDFCAFRDTRPAEEKWELIDGVPMMMPPPTIVHQIIARNLVRHLTDALDRVKPNWLATHEVGVQLPGGVLYHPEPDAVVIDADVAAGQRYAETFYLVAEVLSDSDSPEPIAAKLAFYQSHPANECVLLIGQDAPVVEVYERGVDRSWHKRRIDRTDAMLSVAAIGDICTITQLYRGTPLQRTK
jgi:Uma2 family endonuclease